jgi:hypothetical protein
MSEPTMKYKNETFGRAEAVFNRLGGEEGVSRFLADETIVVPKTNPISAEGLANGGITFASAMDTRLWLDDQRQFCKDVYGKNLPKVKLPMLCHGFGWGMAMASFMSPQWLFDSAKERIGAWKYWDESLDTVIVKNARDPKKDGSYAFFCRDRVEADEEHKNKSYNQIVVAGITGMTVAEYINLFIWFHWKTGGKLLDRSNWTLLTGSLDRGDYVPYGYGYYGKLSVGWTSRGYADGILRSRQVVLAK